MSKTAGPFGKKDFNHQKMEERERAQEASARTGAQSTGLTGVVQDEPRGVDSNDVKMAKETDKEKVRKYLGPQPGNLSTYFKIGAGFFRQSGSDRLNLGHAAVLIRACDKLTPDDPVLSLEKPLHIMRLEDSKPRREEPADFSKKGRVILIHLRYADERKKEYVTAFEERNTPLPLPLYKYIDLCRVYTTKRMLKHIMINVSPGLHSLVVSDCASVVRGFVQELASQLNVTKLVSELDAAPGISEEDLQKWKKELVEYIISEGESFGESERLSRRCVVL